MGPVPSLSSYQQAAQSIYEPQLQADITSSKAKTAADIANEESLKGQVATDYTSAIDKLAQNVQDQTAKISQLYTERLGGNFSGLQGNDMGQLYARTNEQQSIIEQTRANKLAQISTAETNLQNTGNADLSALTSKYQGLEADYAQKAYGSAVSQYNTDQYRQTQLGLSEARLGIEQQKLANSETASQKEYKASGKGSSVSAGGSGTGDTSKGYNFTGPNGEPINMSQYIQGAGKNGQDIINLLQNGSSYDRNIAKQVQKANPQNDQELIAAVKKYDTGNYYGF